MNDLVNKLMEFILENPDKNTEVTGFCELEGDFFGYDLFVTIKKGKNLDS